MEYRKHLQAFIDRWRYNANRGMPLLVYLFYLTPDGLRASRPGSVEDQNSGEGELFLASKVLYWRLFGLVLRSCPSYSHLKKMKRKNSSECGARQTSTMRSMNA